MRASLVILAALAFCVASLGLVVAATGMRADDADRASVALHRHFVQTPSGLVEVGPRACVDPAARHAFNKFHANVHVHVAGSPEQAIGIVARACGVIR